MIANRGFRDKMVPNFHLFLCDHDNAMTKTLETSLYALVALLPEMIE